MAAVGDFLTLAHVTTYLIRSSLFSFFETENTQELGSRDQSASKDPVCVSVHVYAQCARGLLCRSVFPLVLVEGIMLS